MITTAVQKSTALNERFKRQFKKHFQKNEVYQQYKYYYRNLLSTLMNKRKKKKIYYEQYFKNNLNNLKNIWKGIRSMIAIKRLSASNKQIITHKGATVADLLLLISLMAILAQSQAKANIKLSNK